MDNFVKEEKIRVRTSGREGREGNLLISLRKVGGASGSLRNV